MSRARLLQVLLALALAGSLSACAAHTAATPPGATPAALPGAPASAGPPPSAPGPPPAASEPVPAAVPVPAPVREDPLREMSIDDLNRGAALKPVFFQLDSDQLDDTARQVLGGDSELLRKYPSWIITIEGHCDERGSAEYNLALGERRAQAARTYLVSLGVSPDRLKTVSYGNEFPFDPGHTEAAWALNRRAQFMVTAK